MIEGHARLDLAVFSRIAEELCITIRYVGEEPTSQVTGLYNKIMEEELPKARIQCRIFPRKMIAGQTISASTVRKAVRDGNDALLRTLVPETTYAYFKSPEAAPIIKRIRNSADVIHY